MPTIALTEILRVLLTMSFLCILWSMFVAWAWMIWRLFTGQSILPENSMVNRRQPPWGAGTVLFVFLPLLATQVDISQWTGKADPPAREVVHEKVASTVTVAGKDHPPGVSAPAAAGSEVELAVEGAKAAKLPGAEKRVRLSRTMLLNAVVEIFMLILVTLVARLTCGARLRDFGLSLDGCRRQAALGVVATLIAAPAINGIQFLATKIWAPQPHPVQEMILREFSPAVGVLAVLTAVVLAPIFEELVFRGLLQSWLVVLLRRHTDPLPDPPMEATPFTANFDPYFAGEFSVAKPLDGPYLPTLKTEDPDLARSRALAWVAIVLTSLVFAFVHAPQWPAPIPLFVLALVIGKVYQRTGSLIAAVFMHATFNGLSMILLFLALVSGVKVEPDEVIGRPIGPPPTVKIEKQRLMAVSASARLR